ncbi:mitochondrial import receptor subunit TOM22 homolog isoform X2 [Anopheles ziemanni]|uniref:mitochondrial import receptor subunit TOM22 homolog isoform X1 n=1 Tax=Anopheles coustani TaxID=139045 RepID=UPI00265A5501|nr:mitochondrial import receptor subunit TOM22 homolog isoform X1 [Anopheles coustani]XP_058167767.1 mitochondrial import receptor subunit TOM22 homolog isoform X2 [Anopheles ziemanni]
MDSDPEVVLVEKIEEDEISTDKDSGMESATGSKDETPERKTVARTNADDSYDDEPDESLGERLWGLTEMFPEPVRAFSGAVTGLTVRSVKGLYSLTCNASWIFFTTSMILFAPVVFEVERAQMEEMQKSQQKQVLLGPGAAVGGGGAGPGGLPAMPPMAATR